MCRLQAQRRPDTASRKTSLRRCTHVRAAGGDARLPRHRRGHQLCEPPHADTGTPGVGAGVRRLADVGEQPKAPCADVLGPDSAQRNLGHGERGPNKETDGSFEEIPAGRHSPSCQRIVGDDQTIYSRSDSIVDAQGIQGRAGKRSRGYLQVGHIT